MSESNQLQKGRQMNKDRRRLEALVGLAALGAGVSGTASLIAALLPLFAGEFMAAGVCLAAAALSFGLLSNALLRT